MEGFLPIITRRTSMCIPLNEIDKIERVGRKVRISLTDGRVEWTGTSIRELKKYLDERFFPALAGMVINLDHVRRMENLTVYFDDGDKAIMGRDGYIRTRQAFNAYMRTGSPQPEKSSSIEE